MFHKNIRKIHLLYGGVICILLVPLVIFLISSWNSIPQEPIKIYKTPVLKKQTPEKVEETPTPEEPSRDESETWDSEEPEITETETSEEESQDEFSETLLPQTKTSEEDPKEDPEEDPKVVFLKEVFPKLDHHLSEGKKLMEEIAKEGVAGGNYDVFKARAQALEAEFQEYCKQIADEFPDAVTFITLRGQQSVYDVDFQILQDSLEAVPSELSEYFRYTRLREWFGFPDVPPEQLQQLQ